LALLEYSME